jgi:hypothetical protein
MVKEGGTLHEQRLYEETSWRFFFVSWWLSGRCSDVSLAFKIATLEASLKLHPAMYAM